MDDRWGLEQWRREDEAIYCYRSGWRDGRCIWHADVSDKPIKELKAARAEDLERLDGAILRGTEIKNEISLVQCGLTNANLWGADLTGADLVAADLTGADLVAATLTNANLRGADLTNAVLAGADLTDADLGPATLTDANLRPANSALIYANRRPATLTNANLRYASLTNANLLYATLTNAHLRYASLTDTRLRHATLTDAYLPDADLTNADLQGADFNWGTLTGATLKTVDLSTASLLGTDLEQANLTRADLGGATLYGARLFDTRLLDVAINDRTEFSEACIYDRWADPTDPHHTDQPGFVPHEDGYIDQSAGEIDVDEDRLRQYIAFGGRVATALDHRVQRAQHDRLSWFRSTGRRELARFRRHQQFSSEQAHQAVEHSDRAISVYRERQRLYRENSLPDGVPQPYIREKHVRRKRAFIRGNRLDWLKYALSRWVMLYGERPGRVVGSSIVLIVCFGVVYPLVGGVSIEPGAPPDTIFDPVLFAGQLPEALSDLLVNLYFSAVTFTTLGYGGMQPARPATQFLASVESLLGGVMIALLVTVLGRRVMR
jgi:uncharacterized protein YjbI with pentapeptide repeats